MYHRGYDACRRSQSPMQAVSTQLIYALGLSGHGRAAIASQPAESKQTLNTPHRDHRFNDAHKQVCINANNMSYNPRMSMAPRGTSQNQRAPAANEHDAFMTLVRNTAYRPQVERVANRH